MMRLSKRIADQYLVEVPGSALVRHRSGKVHMLRFRNDGVAECGSEMPTGSQDRDTVLGHGEQWCFSCLGNALAYLEREYDHAV